MEMQGINPSNNNGYYVDLNKREQEKQEQEKWKKWQPLVEFGVFLANPIGATLITADKVVEIFNDNEGLTEIADEKLKELDEKYPVRELTKRTWQEKENFGDFLAMQNYIATNVMEDGFSVDELEKYINTWKEINDAGRNEGVKIIESDLSEEENDLAMDYAIQLLENRINQNKEDMPEYGDCKSYYNEGSLLDWGISHPISFGIEAIDKSITNGHAELLNTMYDENGNLNNENFQNWIEEVNLTEEEGIEYLSVLQEKVDIGGAYKHLAKDILGKDGMFTLQNIPNYIERAKHKTINNVRASHWTEMLQINSTKTISEQLNNQEQLLEELKSTKDNPEKFAQIYYQITNGINFDAEKVLNYKNDVLSEDGVDYTEEVIIGRNFLNEDITKNRMGTDILFEVNKSVGTALCKRIPAGSFLTAEAINLGVTYLDNETQGEKEVKKDNFDILVEETLRSLLGTKGEGMAKKLVEKTGINPTSKAGKWLTRITNKHASSKTHDATNIALAATTSETIGEALKKSIKPSIDGIYGIS